MKKGCTYFLLLVFVSFGTQALDKKALISRILEVLTCKSCISYRDCNPFPKVQAFEDSNDPLREWVIVPGAPLPIFFSVSKSVQSDPSSNNKD